MREIKFRGKRINNNEWSYGDLSVVCGRSFISDHLSNVRLTSISTLGMAEIKFCEVKSETVGQYTGLKDKNGVEIYERDVVELKGDFKFVFGLNVTSSDISTTRNEIVWHNDGWGLKWLYSNEWSDVQCTARGHVTEGATAKMVKYMTVIGNIHQNPELLEVK